MNTRHRVVVVLLIVTASACPLLLAQDPPHWLGQAITDITCTSQCHALHGGSGTALTGQDNISLCQVCHTPGQYADKLALTDAMKANPGVGGSSHAFGVSAENAARGATTPTDPGMAVRVIGGNIVCSTCHNQHASNSAFGGTPRISETTKFTDLGGTGTVTSGGTFNGAEGYFYIVRIMQGAPQEKFGYSKDNGLSWFPVGCDLATPNPCPTPVGTVALADGVEVTFDGGTYNTGEEWEFSASWPFLRAALGDGGDNLCYECHTDWYMDHNAVETEGWSTTSYRSHPVGVSLNVNGRGYDRAVPLDGNGADQGSGGADSNASNDLPLYGVGNTVECLTCHAVHHADSQTSTSDGP